MPYYASPTSYKPMYVENLPLYKKIMEIYSTSNPAIETPLEVVIENDKDGNIGSRIRWVCNHEAVGEIQKLLDRTFATYPERLVYLSPVDKYLSYLSTETIPTHLNPFLKNHVFPYMSNLGTCSSTKIMLSFQQDRDCT